MKTHVTISVPESITFLAGGHLSRRIYAVVGRSTATTEAADMACIPSSLTSSRWLMALAPSSAPSWTRFVLIQRGKITNSFNQCQGLRLTLNLPA